MKDEIKRNTNAKRLDGYPKRKEQPSCRQITTFKNNIKNPVDELNERALKLLRNDLY